jgi:hypothetical protein
MISLKELLSKALQRLPHPFPRLSAEWNRTHLRRAVTQQFTAGGAGWPPEGKVFGIGLARTGTTSLTHALRHLGYRAFHFSRNGKVLGWPEFFDAEAATDTPCSAQFEALYHAFDDSKFVYTGRDIDAWARSMQEYHGLDTPSDFRALPRQEAYWQSDRNWGWYNQTRLIQIRESLYARHDTWAEAYRFHDDRVRRFFEDKPDDRFLEMNIPDGDGWDVLCPFLGVEAPDRPFPHQNEYEYS